MARRCVTDLDLHLLLLEDFALHQTASASGRASLRLVMLRIIDERLFNATLSTFLAACILQRLLLLDRRRMPLTTCPGWLLLGLKVRNASRRQTNRMFAVEVRDLLLLNRRLMVVIGDINGRVDA